METTSPLNIHEGFTWFSSPCVLFVRWLSAEIDSSALLHSSLVFAGNRTQGRLLLLRRASLDIYRHFNTNYSPLPVIKDICQSSLAASSRCEIAIAGEYDQFKIYVPPLRSLPSTWAVYFNFHAGLRRASRLISWSKEAHFFWKHRAVIVSRREKKHVNRRVSNSNR